MVQDVNSHTNSSNELPKKSWKVCFILQTYFFMSFNSSQAWLWNLQAYSTRLWCYSAVYYSYARYPWQKYECWIGLSNSLVLWRIQFLQCVSIACYEERWISCDRFGLSVCLSHSGILSKRLELRSCGLQYRIAHDSNFLSANITAKFQREPRERGHWMREG